MPFCPSCKYEYVQGVTRCSDCNEELVDQLSQDCDEAVAKPTVAEDAFVPFFTSIDRLEMEMVKGILIDNEIPAIESSAVSEWSTRRLRERTITVLASRLEDARAVLEEAERAGREMFPDEEVDS
jgi:hypothetical protein